MNGQVDWIGAERMLKTQELSIHTDNTEKQELSQRLLILDEES